ncbi:MAG: dNTP triphosphohydrolase [Pirellulaceae bacterium]|nr:dNTP triphosphohydrolase [Pirellulaceae bacterium]
MTNQAPIQSSRPASSAVSPDEAQWAIRERQLLAPYAMFAGASQGRRFAEPLHPYRSPFQRDRDRILHSAAFRRLSGKMQVFTGEMGDYHRTRLTHTHEVATIARTLGRVLRLNEDLIEALALLHDIGHPPFGHSGEEVLQQCLSQHGGFSHNRFALTLAEELETRYTPYPGLNLSREILLGQDFRITHAGQTPLLEVQVVDLADSIAYNAHDADDALKLGLLKFGQIQSLDLIQRAWRWTSSQVSGPSETALRQMLVHHLIDVQVADLLEQSQLQLASLSDMDSTAIQAAGIELQFSSDMLEQRRLFSAFMFSNVYRHPQLVSIRRRAAQKVEELYQRLTERPEILPPRFLDRAQRVGIHRAVGEYIGGMTDRFCDSQHRQLIELGESAAIDWY